MSAIKIQQLKYFLKVVEEGSLSKAAVKLGVAQPALSQNIINLEYHYQTKLLDRSSRGVSATLAGTKLCEHAMTILRQIDQADLEIRHLNKTPRGEVVVALASASSIFFAAPLIKAVAQDYPEIKVTIRESMSSVTFETLARGHADLALVPNGHLIKGAEAETVMIENLYFGGRATENLKGNHSIKLKEVSKYPLIITSGPQSSPQFARNTLVQAAFDKGYNLNIIGEQESGRILQSLLLEGLGYAVLPWPAFYSNHAKEGFVVKKVIDPEMSRPLTIAWLKQSTISDRVIVVRDKLRLLVKELHKKGVLKGELKIST